MKIQESAENYLETILMLQKKNGMVRSIDIANELDYSKPSISVAMKNLRENGYIFMDENNLIVLTEEGKQIAERVYERHELFTKWLVYLGVSEEQAEEDACRIEHYVSQETFDAIKRHIKEHNEE